MDFFLLIWASLECMRYCWVTSLTVNKNLWCFKVYVFKVLSQNWNNFRLTDCNSIFHPWWSVPLLGLTAAQQWFSSMACIAEARTQVSWWLFSQPCCPLQSSRCLPRVLWVRHQTWGHGCWTSKIQSFPPWCLCLLSVLPSSADPNAHNRPVSVNICFFNSSLLPLLVLISTE